MPAKGSAWRRQLLLGGARPAQDGATPVQGSACMRQLLQKEVDLSKVTTLKRPAAAAAQASAQTAKAAKAEAVPKSDSLKRPGKDAQTPSATQVKYTHATSGGVRTYCQAWVDGKWQHVLTIMQKHHAEHQAMVERVGEELRQGKLSFQEAKAKRKTVLQTWPAV